MKNIKHYFKGFTLVELIIVITILAILATIAFISFQDYTKGARDANRVSTLKNIETGLELFTLKTGNFPKPDEAKVFTGGLNGKSQINQGVIGENVSRIIQMNKTPLDPKDSSNYVYSTFGNNKYYQIGIDSEQKEISFLPQVYAKSNTSIVKGNYKFDPSLPSLILVENEALMNSGIFSPEVCFVLDGGKNSLNECREIKSEMNLKDYDSSLVGYWDMETVTGNLLKDLSGNENNAVFTGIILPTSTGGYIGKGLLFGSGFIEIPDYSTRGIHIGTEGSFSFIINKFDNNTLSILGKRYNSHIVDYIIYFDTNSKLVFHGTNQSGIWWKNSILSKNNYLNHIYYYGTIVFSKGNIKYYLNGRQIDTDREIIGENMLATSTGTLQIGAKRGGEIFHGVIDDIKIYNRALTDEEIKQQSKIAGF